MKHENGHDPPRHLTISALMNLDTLISVYGIKDRSSIPISGCEFYPL
jgi:hypothetical protein